MYRLTREKSPPTAWRSVRTLRARGVHLSWAVSERREDGRDGSADGGSGGRGHRLS
jgi:hypothetical protein